MKDFLKRIGNIFSIIWKVITLLGSALIIIFMFLGQNFLPFSLKNKTNDKINKEIKSIKSKAKELDNRTKEIKKENEEILKNKKERDKKAQNYFPNLGD